MNNMRKILIPVLFITLNTFTFPEGEVIDLKNNIKKENTFSSKNKNIEIPINNFKNKSLLPKSIYIGELSDYKSIDINRNKIVNIIDNFINDIKINKEIKSISMDFKFIFENVYTELLLKKYSELIRWNIGFVDIYNQTAEANIEIYFRNNIYVGVIYLEKETEWLITDLQLEDQERQEFDPSSPLY